MSHRHNPGFDDPAFEAFDDDGPGTSPTSVGGWPEPEYREPVMDPLLDMANRVAGLPERYVEQAKRTMRFFAEASESDLTYTNEEIMAPMHQSLDGEARRRDGLDWMQAHNSAFRVRSKPLREAVRSALLSDLPVTESARFERLVDRAVAAVEALGEPEDERARRLAR
jgi:hypothetical protein